MDLIIRNAQLPHAAPGELVDIGIDNGRIVAVQPQLVAEAETFDANGMLINSSENWPAPNIRRASASPIRP